MNFLANLREAYVLLKRAEELGQFFQHSPEEMKVVDIARRATAKAIQLSSQKNAPQAGT